MPGVLFCPVRQDPRWVQQTISVRGRPLPTLLHRQHVSFPFAGIGGPERAMLEGKWPFKAVNIIECRKQCMAILNKLQQPCDEPVKPTDAFKLQDSDLVDSDGFFSTSPCTSFSTQGGKGGFNVDDGKLFWRQMDSNAHNPMGTGQHGMTADATDFPGKAWYTMAKKDDVEALAEMPPYKLSVKFSEKQMQKNNVPEWTSTIGNRKFLGEIKNVVESGLPAIFSQGKHDLTMDQDHGELQAFIMDFQLSVNQEQSCGINVTSFCLPELRVTIAGSYWLIGIKASALVGDNITKKVEHFENMRVPEALELAKKEGFFAEVVAGSALAIPAGMILASIMKKDTTQAPTWVRWGIYSSDRDKDVCRDMLKDLLQSHPYLAGTDYQVVLRFIDC